MDESAARPGEPREIRALLFYRLTILLLLAVVACLLFLRPADPRAAQETGERATPTGPAPSDKSVIIADLAAATTDITHRYSSRFDHSTTYYQTPSASVHMHSIGFEQTCPLHIHPETEEVTIIVTGTPFVSHIYADGEELVRADGSYGPGTLVYSPAFCGHKWVNRAKDSMQANLVFAAPPFDGNFYLEGDDHRLKRGGRPLVIDPDEALRSFLAAGEPYLLKPLSVLDGKMSSLLVKEEAGLDPDPSPILIYVTRGEGSLLADREYPLRHQQLALVVPNTRVRVKATPGAPMATVVFRPEVGEAVGHSTSH